MNKIKKTEKEWRQILSKEEYYITREKGTEPAFSGMEFDISKDGSFICKCCSAELFDSSTKYDSRSGWPSFFDGISKEAIKTEIDNSHGMIRTEIMCANCDAHLGHVFDDGPKPTGKRYCVNSLSIKYKTIE